MPRCRVFVHHRLKSAKRFALREAYMRAIEPHCVRAEETSSIYATFRSAKTHGESSNALWPVNDRRQKFGFEQLREARRVADFANRPDRAASKRSIWVSSRMSPLAKKNFEYLCWPINENSQLMN
jgi:hypothetical protein